MTNRTVRYQGAIRRGDHLLLIKHRENSCDRAYWLLPGGGRENGESEEECVEREMREETNLDVSVERLLLDEPAEHYGTYQRKKTYLCRIVGGEARPGYEPEAQAAEIYTITDIGWFDLRHPENWDALAISDSITFPQLQRIRTALGYAVLE